MPRSGLHDYAKLVSVPVQRRLFSLLAGTHQGEQAGSSHEFLDMAEYKIGDDISDIDWKTSARMGQPIVKRFESAAVLSIYLVVDTGANMAALAADGSTSKKEVGEEFCTAIAWLTAMRGDLLGLVVGNAQRVRSFPARSGLSHAETVLRVATSAQVDSPEASVLQLLRRLDTTLQRRSMILLVTDQQQITPEVWRPLRRLLTRHRVGVLLAEDLDPTLAAARSLSDVQAGPIPDFVRDDPTIAHQWAIALREQRRRAHDLLSGLQIPFATAGSREEILPSLVKVLEGGEARGRTAS